MKLLLFFLLFYVPLCAIEDNEILLIHSYNKGLKWTDGISKGLEDVIAKHKAYELTTEYMDSKKIDSKQYFNALMNLYKIKFAHRKYKVVIASDNYAFKLVLANQKKLFKNAPIVFCGVEDFNKKDIPPAQQNSVTGVVEYKEIIKNIELIQSLMPHLNTLYIISDNSFSSLAIKKQILDSVKLFEHDFKIVFDNDIILKTLHQKIDALPEHSAVLLTSLYKDKFGEYIPYNDLRNFFYASKYPIFAVNKIHLGEGIVGGVMINPYDQGYMAGAKAFEIIDGKSPGTISVSIPAARYYFDYKMLKKYGFSVAQLPTSAVVENGPQKFSEKHRKLIDSAFAMMPLLILLIIILMFNIIKKIQLETKLIEQNELDNVLLNNIKSAIFWKSKNNKILGCNESLCHLVGMEKRDIIGKQIEDILPELCTVIHDSNPFVNEMEMVFKKIKKEPIDVVIRRKQYLDKNNHEAGVVTLISDITEIKKNQLKRKKEEQFIIQRSKLSEIGEMMTSIAHQWKAPLVEISTIAQELLYTRKKRAITPEGAKEFVDDIMRQVQYMSRTIDDFRAFIKPSASKSHFKIKQAIHELVNIVKNNLDHNYIEVQTIIDDDYITYGYPNELKQSILNILNNAKDSILKKKTHEDFDARIMIEVYKKEQIFISIKDNGGGIETSLLSSIFEPFFTSKEDGDGFGLYMAKLIIEEKMHGHIDAIPCNEGAHILIQLAPSTIKEDKK
ncbi:sensor histidine kinase [Sulfurospirillum sp. 1612]|uniref:sensor histidine kinase n=1 Tax=Sulfurospirillum sp. 1612 TaxID=3094835 RepID=UPI002F94CE08